MEQDSKQESFLKKTVNILAEMTKKDIQKLDNPEDFSDIKVIYTDHYGWSLKKKSVPPPSEQNS